MSDPTKVRFPDGTVRDVDVARPGDTRTLTLTPGGSPTFYLFRRSILDDDMYEAEPLTELNERAAART